jgi:hypothetical protein
MHKPQGHVVLCTYCTFKVFVFKFCILEHELLLEVYIGFINFWNNVVDHVYRGLETFYLVTFLHHISPS